MAVQHLWVPGPFPTLNELLAARDKRSRITGYSGYSALKKPLEQRVVLCARAQRLKKMQQAYFTYLLCEESRRRDPSNVAASAVKIIEDALQEGGFLPNDGWKQVLGYAVYWQLVSEQPGIAVFFSAHAVLDRATAIYNDSEIRGCQSKTTKR